MSQPNNPEINSQANHKIIAEKLAQQLDVVQQMTDLIAVDQGPEETLRIALQHLTHTLGFDAAQIYRLSPTRKDLWLYLELGSGNKPVTQIEDLFSVDENNIISHAARDEKPIHIPDIHQSPYSYFGQSAVDAEIKSELALPLKSGQFVDGLFVEWLNRLNASDFCHLAPISSPNAFIFLPIKPSTNSPINQIDRV